MDVIYQLKKQIGKTISVLLFGWCFNGYSTSIKEINRYSNGVVLFDVFNGCSISIKEINSLIWKRMSNIYYWEKLIFSKLRFFLKENLKKYTNLEEQRGTTHIWRNLYISITVFSCFSSTKSCLEFPLNCFVREIKGFYQSFFENEIDFKDIMKMKEQWLKQLWCLPVTGKPMHLFSCEIKDEKIHF